jgi:hypothetical protein
MIECPNCHEKLPAGEQPYVCPKCGCKWIEQPSERHTLIRRILLLGDPACDPTEGMCSHEGKDS